MNRRRDLGTNSSPSPRPSPAGRGRSNCPIFAIVKFAVWRQRMEHSAKSVVVAAALQDASDARLMPSRLSGLMTEVKRIYFVTGTDTGAGKTVLTVLLVNHLRSHGVNAVALKPVCSGGRSDARRLFAAMDGALPLDEINPWHFRAAIAPSLAARQEKKKVKLAQAVARIRRRQKKCDVLVVEGAGGLLSPLGEDFNSRDLIMALGAVPIIAAPNRLGVVNHVLLTLEALPKLVRAKARVVLMPQRKPDISAKSNASLLAEFFDAGRILNAGGRDFVSKISQCFL